MNDKWKYVSVGKCVGAIIWSIIGLATIFIPFSLSSGTVLTLKYMPIFGDGSIFIAFNSAYSGLGTNLSLPNALVSFLTNVSQVVVYAFLIIMLVTILFGLILAITRVNVLRIIFKVFSIFFGIALIFIGLCYVLYIPGAIMSYMQIDPSLANLSKAFLDTGVIYALGTAIFSFVIASKQFKFFSKPF